MKISILVDNPKSWIMPYAEILLERFLALKHEVRMVQDIGNLREGDCAFFLGCEKIVPRQILNLNKHNLVVHESDLPRGKGWSPLTWQILEGKNEVPISLFEAEDEVDSGEIYLQDVMHFEGHELIDELRVIQGSKTVDMALEFIERYAEFEKSGGKKQEGKETFYPRRRSRDSELETDKSIIKLFNKLRVVDNERYPAFFKYKGHTYTIKIEKRN